MSNPPRVALMFEYDGGTFQSRELARGVHRWLSEHPGRWLLTHDPYAVERLGTVYQGLIGPPGVRLVQAMEATGGAVVGTTARQPSLPMPRVMENRWLAGSLAARHLIERGYHHFGFLGSTRDMASLVLEQGFRNALHSRGRGCDILVASRRYRLKARNWARHRARVAWWLDELKKPVGIVAARDVLALYLAELCAEKGLRVPDDVGIVGAGNDPALCLCPPRPLTSLDFAYDRVGYQAAALLDELLRGGPPPGRNVLVRPVLVARESTGRTFARSDAVSRAMDYIREFAHRPLRVSDVARVAGVSERQLVRRFREVRRHTVVEEIGRVRLAHAESLLQATDLSAQAIARAVGFHSDRHLARLFVRHHGVTPGEWRRGRPVPPASDPNDVERAKRLLRDTTVPVAMVAEAAGCRDVRAFREAFARRVGCLPGAYRRRCLNGQAGVRRLTFDVHIHCDGEPDGHEQAAAAATAPAPEAPVEEPVPEHPAEPARSTRLLIPMLPRAAAMP